MIADAQWEVVPFFDTLPDAAQDEAWQEVDEFGLGVLVLWNLRHTRTASVPAGPPPITRVTQESAGETTSWERPRTAQEQSDLDDDLDELLAEAGIPPRPRGMRWFVRLPASVDLQTSITRWWQEIYQQLDGAEQTTAGELRVVGQILEREGLLERAV